MKPVFATILLLACCLPARAQAPHDGQLFDPGVAMTERAAEAPEALDQMAFWRGQWDVALTTFPTDSTMVTQPAQAEITFMNRGHAFMERLYSPDFNGQGDALHTLAFLSFVPGPGLWNHGIADSHAEAITLYDGNFEGDDLVVRTAIRRGGGAQLTHYRAIFDRADDDHVTYTLETSTDHGATWKKALVKSYTRRAPEADFLATSDDYGSPAPNRAKEAAQFDFLLGTWDSAHNMTFPNGQTAQWPSTSTAVYALGGKAILEFDWFDLDPNLPDASTSIIRLYNRAMNRWESLYLTNRGNAQLFFGGAWAGDRMVLHPFETDAAAPQISRYVFHDIGEDSYHWYGGNSTDRGATYKKFWIIDVTRRASQP